MSAYVKTNTNLYTSRSYTNNQGREVHIMTLIHVGEYGVDTVDINQSDARRIVEVKEDFIRFANGELAEGTVVKNYRVISAVFNGNSFLKMVYSANTSDGKTYNLATQRQARLIASMIDKVEAFHSKVN